MLAEIPGVGSRDRAATRALTAFMARLGRSQARGGGEPEPASGRGDRLGPRTGDRPGKSTEVRVFGTSERSGPPLLTVHDPKVLALFDSLPLGPAKKVTVSVHLDEPVTRPVKVRNVVGLLRGSDPDLKNTYVLVTAHYDHVGNHGAPGEKGDQIYNGANDDGSGTVSVDRDRTRRWPRSRRHPKRSILFMTFFGEEKGLLGSRYYGRHPLVPIKQTVADINLEQVGRTDDPRARGSAPP